MPETGREMFCVAPDVVASELPNGAALLDMRAGKYYSLNIVGAHIWNHIRSPASLQSVIASVGEKFDVRLEECERDVNALLAALTAAGLVEVARVDAAEPVD
jgi:hypothetical protein